MNKQPVVYYQTDPKWANHPYAVKGENATVGGSGCGPSCAAMLIETLTGKTYTPKDACDWSLAHGYKALNQGTYYTYFAAQFKACGINCWQLSWTNTYHNPKSAIHMKAFKYLEDGCYLIALMKKGLWTSGGHFVLVYGLKDGKVYINDPASTKEARTKGDYNQFVNEVAYYWVVDGRSMIEKEDREMTKDEFYELFKYSMDRYMDELRTAPPSSWSESGRKFAVNNKLITGSGKINGEPNYMWKALLSREEWATLAERFAKLLGVK